MDKVNGQNKWTNLFTLSINLVHETRPLILVHLMSIDLTF